MCQGAAVPSRGQHRGALHAIRWWRFPARSAGYVGGAQPQAMGKVLGIVYRAISTHLTHKAGFSLKEKELPPFHQYGQPPLQCSAMDCRLYDIVYLVNRGAIRKAANGPVSRGHVFFAVYHVTAIIALRRIRMLTRDWPRQCVIL